MIHKQNSVTVTCHQKGKRKERRYRLI